MLAAPDMIRGWHAHVYFDPASRKTQNAATLMQQVTQQLRSVEIPRIDDTLAALATAAAGR